MIQPIGAKIAMSEFILPLIMLVIVAFWFVVAYLTRKTNPGSSKLAIRGGILAAVMFIALALIAALQVKITAWSPSRCLWPPSSSSPSSSP